MHVIIPAAGRGSRLGVLTNDRPKWMVELSGRSLCDRFFDTIKETSVDTATVVVGYMGHKLEDHLGGMGNVNFVQNHRWSDTNMVYSIMRAAEHDGYKDSLISYSDIFFTAGAVRALTEAEGDIVLCYDPDPVPAWSRRYEDPLSDLEAFRITDDQRITRIGGREKSLEDIQGQFMGLFKVTNAGWMQLRDALDHVDQARRDTIDVTSLLAIAIDRGLKVRGVANPGKWGEIDTPDDLKLYAAEPTAV